MPSKWLNNFTIRIPYLPCVLIYFRLFNAGFLLGLLFNPEGGSNMFLRNVGLLSMNHMALYPLILHREKAYSH
jgi:hypothetical protein